MKLIKTHNESIEGNKAILTINIERLESEINSTNEYLNKCYANCDMAEAEYYEDYLEELEDQLEEIQ